MSRLGPPLSSYVSGGVTTKDSKPASNSGDCRNEKPSSCECCDCKAPAQRPTCCDDCSGDSEHQVVKYNHSGHGSSRGRRQSNAGSQPQRQDQYYCDYWYEWVCCHCDRGQCVCHRVARHRSHSRTRTYYGHEAHGEQPAEKKGKAGDEKKEKKEKEGKDKGDEKKACDCGCKDSKERAAENDKRVAENNKRAAEKNKRTIPCKNCGNDRPEGRQCDKCFQCGNCGSWCLEEDNVCQTCYDRECAKANKAHKEACKCCRDC